MLREIYDYMGYETVWVTTTGECDLCQRLNGMVVGAGSRFTVDTQTSRLYPPIHKGCTCQIAAREKPLSEIKDDVEDLPIGQKSGIIISDKQIGHKCGEHMQDWGLNPADAADRERFLQITKDIYENADEADLVEWLVDPITNKRTGLVIAYIKDDDVVLTTLDEKYITTMKGGRFNERVKHRKPRT